MLYSPGTLGRRLPYTAFTMNNLRSEIERLFALGMDAKKECGALETFQAFREALSQGEMRAAEKRDGRWQANVWVKEGILLGFRLGAAEETHAGDVFTFVDRHTYPVRHFKCEDGVRIVPGGSTVREGAYLAHGRDLYASDVRQRGRLCGRGDDGGFACAGGLVRADWQAGASERGVAGGRSAGAGEARLPW